MSVAEYRTACVRLGGVVMISSGAVGPVYSGLSGVKRSSELLEFLSNFDVEELEEGGGMTTECLASFRDIGSGGSIRKDNLIGKK
jgi:hypothetical protein